MDYSGTELTMRGASRAGKGTTVRQKGAEDSLCDDNCANEYLMVFKTKEIIEG